MRIPAHQIQPGDLIDLEGDPFADPRRDNCFLRCELALAMEVEQETPECVAIGFEGFDVVGFPTNHMLNVKGHEPCSDS